MSTLSVLQYPHKGLREVAPLITVFDDGLRQKVKEMFDTMYQDNGVGLAATQVGLALRLYVMDASPHQNQPLCLINPEVIAAVGEVESEEGCLSFPGVYAKVIRAREVTVQYQDEYGNSHTLTADGLMANCIQHELDHLNGVLFIDHLSKLKRERLLKKLEKIKRVA